jgi:hypothetical protein
MPWHDVAAIYEIPVEAGFKIKENIIAEIVYCKPNKTERMSLQANEFSSITP